MKYRTSHLGSGLGRRDQSGVDLGIVWYLLLRGPYALLETVYDYDPMTVLIPISGNILGRL